MALMSISCFCVSFDEESAASVVAALMKTISSLFVDALQLSAVKFAMESIELGDMRFDPVMYVYLVSVSLEKV